MSIRIPVVAFVVKRQHSKLFMESDSHKSKMQRVTF